MGDEPDTIANAGRIIELCKKVGTKPVIFETWAEKRKLENQQEMNRRYRELAASPDGSYLYSEDGKEELMGEHFVISDGGIV